jgi:hypothetical protein
MLTHSSQNLFCYHIEPAALKLSRAAFGILSALMFLDYFVNYNTSAFRNLTMNFYSRPTVELNTVLTDESGLLFNLIYVCGLLLSVLLTVGFRPRTCALLLWALYSALCYKYEMMWFGADRYLHHFLLLFALSPPDNQPIPKWYAFLVYVQISAIYLLSGFGKNIELWVFNPQAILMYFQNPTFSTPLANTIALNFPAISYVLSPGMYVLEIAAGLSFLFGLHKKILMPLIVLPLLAFHGLSPFVFSLHLLPYLAFAALILIFPNTWIPKLFVGPAPHPQPSNSMPHLRNFAFLILVISVVCTSGPIAITKIIHDSRRTLAALGIIQRWSLFTTNPMTTHNLKFQTVDRNNQESELVNMSKVAKYRMNYLAIFIIMATAKNNMPQLLESEFCGDSTVATVRFFNVTHTWDNNQYNQSPARLVSSVQCL